MNLIKIPFNKPDVTGNEYQYIRKALKNLHISGDGFFTKKCHALLEKTLDVKKVLLTTSCTHALEMAAILLDIKPGDEIIVPSFTFVSTVNSFVLRGASVRLADIRSDTLNLDESKLDGLISSRTKAILPVHYAGIACEMDTILGIAKSKGIAVIEDNAHGLFGKYKKKYLGTFGCMAAQSFHETKNFSCGEGGALLINDKKFFKRAEIIREKGTNRSQFFRGEVKKYSWKEIGSSYLPSDILAAFLLAQLEEKNKIQAKRKKIWQFYFDNLKTWALKKNIQIPYVPEHCEHPYHMFYLILPSKKKRQVLIDHMMKNNILCVSHYHALHLSKMGKKFGGKKGDCPVTERVSDRLVRLPFYNRLTKKDLTRIVTELDNVDSK